MNEVCTTCGALVGDSELHVGWHQRQGDPEDLSSLGGANDVPPLPESDR